MPLKPGDVVGLEPGRTVHFFNQRLGEDPNEPISGAVLVHLNPSNGHTCSCLGTMWFRGLGPIPDGVPLFDLIQESPLTIRGVDSPSIKHALCGDHGYITDGRWIKA